jgi:outer membrane protein
MFIQRFADAKGALKSYESSLIALDSREQSYNYAKERFDVGLLNTFDLSQSQTWQQLSQKF